MNKYKTKFLIAMQVCPIVLLIVFIAASANAQRSATAAANEAAPLLVSNESRVTVPPLPPDLAQVPAGFTAFLEGHGVGTQNYVCRPSATSSTGVAFVLFTPQATLFADNGKQIITHFFSPNPDKDDPNTDPTVQANGMIRVTWQDSKDSSTVWAKVHQPNGAVTVDTNSVAWLTLDAVGAQNGPTGDNTLTKTEFIQRLNTSGGLAPKTGCASLADVGHEAFVPYTADYFFFKKTDQ